MSKRYPGNFITGNPVALSQTSNNGIWDVTDVSAAVAAGTWQEPDGIYEIPKSLRFRKSAGAYLSRTPSTTSDQRTFTYSVWIKPGLLGSNGTNWLLTGNTGSIATNYLQMSFSVNGFSYNSDELQFTYVSGNSTVFSLTSAALHRDPSAWYHVVFVADTSNALAYDRVRMYINGSRINAFKTTPTYPSQNATISFVNSSSYEMRVGGIVTYGTFDGYMAEANFIDGLALDPSYFGYFNPITNIWQPKKYTGAYGTNGFYLPFTEPVATSGTVNAFNLGRNFAGGTNYIRYSQDGSQTSYGYAYNNATNTVNNTVAPDGTTTGNKLTADGTSGVTHRFYCGTVATPAGSTQTTSIYLKYNNCQYVNIENWNGSTYQTQTFDILNGVPAVGLQTAVGFTYQFVGNGWYRVSVPLYAGSANTGGPSIAVYLCDASGNVTWNGNSTSAVYWWGAQLNLGTTADPYLKTASTTAPTSDWTPNNISVTADSTYDSMVDSPTNVFTSLPDPDRTITAVSYTNTGAASGTSLTVSYPASGIINGDLLVMTAGSTNANAGYTWTTPSGWTYATPDDTSSLNCGVWWKYATGTENGTTLTLTESSGSGNSRTAIISVFRNAVFGDVSVFTTVAAGVTSLTSTAVPITQENTIAVIYARTDTGNSTTWSSTNGYTKVAERLGFGGSGLFTKTFTSTSVGDTSVIGNGSALAAPMTLITFTIKPVTGAIDTGGIVPGNYPTWNPIERPDTSANAYAISLSNGNLTTTTTGSEGFSNNTTLGTFQIPTTGKWYWEILITNVATAAASRSHVGIMNQTAKNADGADFGYASAAGAYSYAADGQKSASPGHSLTSYGTSYTNGNTIGVAVDSDAGKIWFAKNNTWQASGDPVVGTNAAFTGLNMTGGFQPASGYWLGCTANFGQRPFTYTPPVGYKSLNTTNLQALGTSGVGNAAMTPNKWFDINRYAGTGTARDIQNSGFQPDIVMVKKISGTDNFEITDSGRGDNLRMYPNTSDQESAGGISLRPDGFNLQSSFGTDNESGYSYIAWQWKQSPTSGLNVIPYTGTGVARSISHNLGVAPRFMLIKQRDVANRAWCVYHEGLSNPQSAFYLDSTSAPFAYTAFFNNTAPSSSNFSLGTDASVNQNNSKYIAYLWAEVPGFSKFGSYAGNGSSDGPFIYLGFKPRWILVRHSNLSSGALRDWLIYDSARTLYNGYNYSDTRAGTQAIISGVPYTGSSGYSDAVDFVSNGFKFKNAASPNFNGSGETYVYAAFAESPFGLNNRAR